MNTQITNVNCNEASFVEAIENADIDFTPAFVHGVLTAYCCQESDAYGWTKILIIDLESISEEQSNQLRFLNQFKHHVAEQLANSELSFQIILNNTSGTLHDEVLLTREWASGYWFGIEALDIVSNIQNDELSTEFFNDLQQIISMPVPSDDDLENASLSDEYSDNYDESDDVYDNDKGDDARADIVEIQEYCRAGAIGVFLSAWKENGEEKEDPPQEESH